MKKLSSATAWIMVAIMVMFTAYMLSQSGRTPTKPFSDFTNYWNNGKVKSIEIKEESMTVDVTLTDNTQFETLVPENRLNQFLSQHENANVSENYVIPSKIPAFLSYLPTIILIVLMIAFFFIFMQQSQGGGNRGVMSFGKSRARMTPPDAKKKVTFKDVAGADEEKAEMAEIVDFLRTPKKYLDMGARVPKGVLLVGPPGTGKTLLAKAISGEAGVPFFSISGSDFVEMFVGVGASRVRDLFEQAKKNSPCIIFIDEIDAVGRQRGAGLGGGHDEREQTLNQLLVEMDGFGQNEGIIVIAATNRPDILDHALLRPGRFDRQIMVGAPDVRGREAILKIHSKGKPLAPEVKLEVLAKRTPGFTGADLENLMNEAALLTVRKNKSQIGMEELEEAVTRVVAGPEKKSRVMSEEDKKITAFHEAGHAVLMQLLPNSDPVHEISIIPRGMAGGYTMSLPEKDESYIPRAKLKDQLVSLLGGRAAEEIVIGDVSTGPKSDIDKASSIARKMVMEYGMSDNIGPITFGTDQDEVFIGRDFGKSKDFSDQLAYKIDIEVKSLIDNSYKKAKTLLTENRNKLNAVAGALIEKEKLNAEEFLEVFNNA